MATVAACHLDSGAISPARLEFSLAERTRPITELEDIDALVKTHRARLLRFVAYSTGDPDLAETIAQDALLRAYNGREKFRGDCSVSTWITGIAVNVIRDHLRTERYRFWRKVKAQAVDVQEMSSFIATDESNPEAQLLAREKVQQLSQILAKLSYHQRTVFLMKFSEEMPVNEISDALHMSVNTVRTHLHRALKAVRGQLGDAASPRTGT